MRIDVEGIIIHSTELSNEELMRKIYSFVNDKYVWRYFFVAVYDDLVGESKHNMVVCGGQGFLHLGGRNTVIASQDKKFKSILHESEARSLLAQSVARDVDNCRVGLREGELSYAQALVRNAVAKAPENCSPNQLYLAVRLGSGLHSINSSGHRASQRIKKEKQCCWLLEGYYPICATNWWNHEIMIFS